MNRMAIVFSLLLVGASVFAEDESAGDDAAFGRYRTILKRMPFGPNPPGFSEDGDAPEEGGGENGAEAAVVQTPEEVQNLQQELAKLIKVKCINVAPGGEVKVGFDDLESKGVFYLSVGSERKGWTVVDADYDKEWAQIARDGVMVTMRLDEGLIDTPVDSKGASWVFTNAAPDFASAKPCTASSTPSASSSGVAAPRVGTQSISLAERLRLRQTQQREAKERREAEIRRQEEERQAQEEERRIKEEEERKANEESRMVLQSQLESIAETVNRFREDQEKAAKRENSDENSESEE